MASTKLSALSAGSAIVDADLFYSAPAAGSQVKQPASAFKTYVLAGAGGGSAPSGGLARPQRSQTATTITVGITDQIINCNISTGAATCTLPLASTRAGVPLTFKDVGGQFATNNLTLTPTSPDLIDGLATFVLRDSYSGVTLVPLNDGTNTGWSVG